MSDFWSDHSSTSSAQPSNGARCLIFGQTIRLLPYFMCANSKSSGETAQMRRLAWAFAGRLCDKYHNLMSWLIFVTDWFRSRRKPADVYSNCSYRYYRRGPRCIIYHTQPEDDSVTEEITEPDQQRMDTEADQTAWTRSYHGNNWAAARLNQQNDVHPAKTSINLGIRPVWSESLLSALRKLRSLATHWAHSEGSDQIGQMLRLIRVFAGRTGHFVSFVMRQLIFLYVFTYDQLAKAYNIM